MPPQTALRPARRPRLAQTAIGLGLAAAIVASWLGLHLYAMFGFALTWNSLPLALAMALLQCWLSVGLFIVSHDAMHGSLVPGGGRLNGAVGAVLLFLYAGFAWKRMRSAHFAHHKSPGSARDPDFDAANPTRFRRWYTTFLTRYFGWRSVLFVSLVVTLYWLVLAVPVEKIVLLYGLPAIASSLQLFYFGTYRPHRHESAGHAGFADRHNARSERFGTLASLASCFHFGYHHEHHRAPDVPWWALPGLRQPQPKTRNPSE
jgi:beta-carotene/zeaxanthin 4-ketolase